MNILEEIKKRITKTSNQKQVQRIYEKEQEEIVKSDKTVTMEVNMPVFVIGFKDKIQSDIDIVKKHIAIEIILYMLLGKSSEAYQELYKSGDIISGPSFEYEFTKQYAHVLITGKSKNPQKIAEMLKTQITNYKKEGLDSNHFERIKKKVYGDYVTQYDDVGNIARMFLSDYFKEINSFDYIDKINELDIEYTNKILNEVFDLNKMVISIVKGK